MLYSYFLTVKHAFTFAKNYAPNMAKDTIKIYGNISEWNENNAREICAQIEAAQGVEVIKLHLHCYGGSVFEGNLIFNAIQNSRTPIDIYIDGVAASMGAILTTAARKVYMAENAFLMLHAPANPTTNGRGTADEHLKTAKLLRNMQSQFIKVLAQRTGKDKETLTAWMNGDNWFSAPEALAENLIDGISTPVAPDINQLTTELVRTAQINEIYGLYAATLQPENNLPKTNNEMDKQKLIDRYNLTGVTAQNTDDEILAAVDQKINAEKTAREQAENELKTHVAAQISHLLDGVKLTPEQRKNFEAIGEKAGITALEIALKPLQTPVPTISDLINNSKGENSPAAATWDELDKNGGLENLRKNNPERFRALFENKFGHAPETY